MLHAWEANIPIVELLLSVKASTNTIVFFDLPHSLYNEAKDLPCISVEYIKSSFVAFNEGGSHLAKQERTGAGFASIHLSDVYPIGLGGV